ncbi:MAG: hypothetical protein ACE5EO_01390 [Candidatus Krumholzibacteriia bacterium]
MFFGVWNSARANKENILYAIVTVFLLERVRAGWNRIESTGRRRGLAPAKVERRQKQLVVVASLLYALPLVLPVVKYFYRSIEELSWSVPGLAAFENTYAFWGLVLLCECFISLVVYNLLRIYVDRMNAAVGFFKAIGRNVRDGSRAAVHAGGHAGTRLISGARFLSAHARTAAAAGTSGLRAHLAAPGGVKTLPARTRALAGAGMKNLVRRARDAGRGAESRRSAYDSLASPGGTGMVDASYGRSRP